MKKITFVTLTVLLFVVSHSFGCAAEITRIKSLAGALPCLRESNSETLVLFDLDETLVKKSEESLSDLFRLCENISLFSNTTTSISAMFFLSELKNKLPKEELIALNIAANQSIKYNLIESGGVPQLIQDLINKKNATVLALTNNLTGSAQELAGFSPDFTPSLQEWRYNLLQNVSLVFSQNYVQTPELPLNLSEEDWTLVKSNYEPPINDPLYYKGIIFTNGLPKGVVLKAFLKQINRMPKKIIFFDDQLDNCKNVLETMKQLNIDVKCFLFIPPMQKRRIESVDESVANEIIQHFKKTGEYPHSSMFGKPLVTFSL